MSCKCLGTVCQADAVLFEIYILQFHELSHRWVLLLADCTRRLLALSEILVEGLQPSQIAMLDEFT